MTTDMIILKCGCVNEMDKEWGVQRSVEKCGFHLSHQQDPTDLGLEYWSTLGQFIEGVPQCARYIQELTSPLAEVGGFIGDCVGGLALEVGCGCSMYAPMLLKRGYTYTALEPNAWAAKWTASTYDVHVTVGTFERLTTTSPKYDLILAAHVVEHLVHAPGSLQKMYNLLTPKGKLLIIVPDDTDPHNPDHLWFFNEKTLQSTLEKCGFTDILMNTKKRVVHENFIYAMASKS